MLMMKMLMQDENYYFLVGCCVMLSGEFPQTTADHVLRNYSNDRIFELGEREIPPAVEIVAIVDCSLPPPLAHDLSDFWWAPFGCYFIPLSPTTSPTSLTRALYVRPEFC